MAQWSGSGPLMADFYALTMTLALFRTGVQDTLTTFHLYIRKNPFQSAYTLTAGLADVIQWLQEWHFTPLQIQYLRQQCDSSGHPLFDEPFLNWLGQARLQLTMDAMPEGTLAFPHEPIVRVHGPVWQCLMVEAALLNLINAQSLFATQASRFRFVAGDDALIEGGLRRAQDEGGFAPTRAAFIGGVDATSNVAAGLAYGIPVRGTFAHAWVMFHRSELEAFQQYAKALPHHGTFLVDTYDTLQGVRNAIATAQETGTLLQAIRLDSGDLAYFSIQARKLLDAASMTHTKIIASNELTPQVIASLKQQGARIDAWLVGTHLVTAVEQPALGGVYKLGAVHEKTGLREVIKLSSDPIKTTIPGVLDVIRFVRQINGHSQWYGDMIIQAEQRDQLVKPVDDHSDWQQLTRDVVSVNLADPDRPKKFRMGQTVVTPLKRIFERGQLVYEMPSLTAIRQRAQQHLAMLDSAHRRLDNPHIYVAGVESQLFEKRRTMIREYYLANQ